MAIIPTLVNIKNSVGISNRRHAQYNTERNREYNWLQKCCHSAEINTNKDNDNQRRENIMNNQETIAKLVSFYGDSSIVPSADQWGKAFECNIGQKICMVNFMKFREQADYPDNEQASGIEAMMRYYEVSHQLVEEVGGEFIASGLFGGILIGDKEEWDAIGIVRYPDIFAFTKVFLDPAYQACHRHRVAATLRHRMAILIEG